LHFLGQELNAAGPSGREVTNTSPPVSSVEELASEEDRPSDLGDLRVKHPPVEREAKAPGRDSRPARGPACLPSLSVSAPRQVTSQHVLSSQRNLLGVDGSGSVEEAEGGQVPGPATARVLTPATPRVMTSEGEDRSHQSVFAFKSCAITPNLEANLRPIDVNLILQVTAGGVRTVLHLAHPPSPELPG